MEDDFLIIVDGEEKEALMSYYNDSQPGQVEEVPLKDMIFQHITNIGFMLKANGSKQVDLAKDLIIPKQNQKTQPAHQQVLQNSQLAENLMEAYIYNEKFFKHDSQEFQEKFSTLLWITYCKKFKPLLIEINKHQGRHVDNLTTDNSWGCTVRCLQMLIANSLVQTKLTVPQGKYEDQGLGLNQKKQRELDILQLFHSDRRGPVAPYSLQNVAEIGLTKYGVYPGDWYGINTASLVFEDLDTKYTPINQFRICTF